MSQFSISLKDGSKITGEYKRGKRVAIFSHGFDVRRDSNGLFHDIAACLPDDFGWVLFDYHAYEGPTETLRPLSQQAAILEHVITWTRRELEPLALHLIAHSMGSTVASFNGNTSFENVILLAPPVRTGGGLRKFFTTHHGSTHYGDYWEIKRRSGKITRVKEKFFTDLENANPEAFIRAYASHVPLAIIAAKQDKYITDNHYANLKKSKKVRLFVIEGDHNFTGVARVGLCTKIQELYKQDLK